MYNQNDIKLNTRAKRTGKTNNKRGVEEMNTNETVTFMDLMGVRLRHMGLAKILDYHQRYIDACNNETEEERELIFRKLRNLELKDCNAGKPFIGLFE